MANIKVGAKQQQAKLRVTSPRKQSAKPSMPTVSKQRIVTRPKPVVAHKHADISISKVQKCHKKPIADMSWQYLRSSAVKKAWAQERELVKLTGKGSDPKYKWTDSQVKTIIRDGRIKGRHGHHIRSVQGHSKKWAADPRNIRFVTPKQHKHLHQGHFHNPTTGRLIDRAAMIRKAKKERERAALKTS